MYAEKKNADHTLIERSELADNTQRAIREIDASCADKRQRTVYRTTDAQKFV